MRYLLHHLLQDAADADPARPAVVDGTDCLTYGELDLRSNQIANLLEEAGVASGDRVALYLDKSLESVVGIYGILKTGAAYVPLDPQAPVARLAYIARNCGVRVLLTGIEKQDAWGALREGSDVERLIALNAAGDAVAGEGSGSVWSAAEIDEQPTVWPSRPTVDHDLAYILYTSGSTGDPKGVMLSHRNALAFVEWATEAFGVNPSDRLSSHAPLHFDLSVFDLYAAAAGGAAVVLVPAKASVFPMQVARFIDEQRITVWYSVPSILSMLTLRGGLHPGSLPTLRTVLFAGEIFPTKYLRQLMSSLPHARFFNLYGPTETNVCTAYEVPPLEDDDDTPIPIGRAIPNDEVFAVTEDGQTAGPGEEGELYVRGATVMHGYWGDEERTARSLIDVAGPGGGFRDRAYRTGDLVRLDSDGDYRLLGRRDAQIKSRGYRIELGDIESALYAHPAVVECAVCAIPDDLVTNRIMAYVVVRNGASAADLAEFCANRIPRYMVPDTFEFRRSLPKTSTGKVDRRGLTLTGATTDPGSQS